MEDSKITLRGVTITKESLEEKYKMQLDDTQWKVLSTILLQSWSQDEEGLRKLVFGHIKKSMMEIGYKLEIGDTQLVFKKIE